MFYTKGLPNRFGDYVEYVQDDEAFLIQLNYYSKKNLLIKTTVINSINKGEYCEENKQIHNNINRFENIICEKNNILLRECSYKTGNKSTTITVYLYKNKEVVSDEYFCYEDVLSHTEIYVKKNHILKVEIDIEYKKIKIFKEKIENIKFYHRGNSSKMISVKKKSAKKIRYSVKKRICKKFKRKFKKSFEKYIKMNSN